MENQSWDGIDRRKTEAPLGVTALNIAARVANFGKHEVNDIFKNTGEAAHSMIRVVDFDNDPLKSRVGAVLEAANLRVAGQKAPAIAKAAEEVEVDPRLTGYKRQYDGSGNSKLKAVPWPTIQSRILEDEDFRLKAAQELEQGGELFGIDAEGNPLISDGGDEPVMKGMNYKDTRDRVHFKHTSNDKAGTLIPGENGQPISTGYEMFGYVEPYGKSDEIIQYEAHTGRKFVQNSQNWCSSWLESGENLGSPENPSWPRFVSSYPYSAFSFVYYVNPQHENPSRGVRRLLRGKRKA